MGREADGWEYDFLSTALKSSLAPENFLKKGVGLFSPPFPAQTIDQLNSHFHSSLVKAIGESS